MSPVFNIPFSVSLLVPLVYLLIWLPDRTKICPDSPVGTRAPSLMMATSTPSGGRPAVVGSAARSAGVAMVTYEASVAP